MKTKEKDIKVIYTEAKDFRTVAATGAWCGVSPTGDIVAHFFVEHPVIPEEININITPDGKKTENVVKESSINFIREQQVGVLMRPDIAKVIGEWLITNADLAIGLGKQK